MVPELEQRSAPPAERRRGGKWVQPFDSRRRFSHFLTKSERVVSGSDPDFDIKGPGDLMVMSCQEQTRASLSSLVPKRSEYDLVWG